MQRLEVSGAVRPIYGSLGVKRLITCYPLGSSISYLSARKYRHFKYLIGFIRQGIATLKISPTFDTFIADWPCCISGCFSPCSHRGGLGANPAPLV